MESSHLNEALLDERSDGIFGMRVLAGVSAQVRTIGLT